MTYPEPQSAFTKIKNIHHADNVIQLNDENGSVLEISFYENIGWELELRHDLFDTSFQRQPYTGAQENISKSKLQYQKDENDNIIISTNTSTLHINNDSGEINISFNNHIVFQSLPQPFSYHKKSVQIYDDIMSRKVTDFSDRAPFSPQGTLFSTHMLRFQYPRPEGVILGLPGQTGEINRNGYRFELYNTDNPVHIPGKPLYQSWPILFHKSQDGNGWIGIFHDNPSRTFVDLGDFYEDKITFESLTGNTRVNIFYGTTLEEVSSEMIKLLGTMELPPLWAFGYQQARWSYMDTTELREVIKKMKESNIPLDALYCDIDYMDGFRVFTINEKTFGDFRKLLEEAKQQDIHVVCIIDPGVKVDDTYSIYQELKKFHGYLTKDGKPFIAGVWPGDVLLPDFGNEKTENWWAEKENEWLEKYPFDGVWNDMNEPSNYGKGGNKANATADTSKGSLQNDYNLYGYYMAQASKKGWDLYAPNKRGVIISRSGYPGIQQYAVVWHGDNHAWWEHLKLALTTTIAYSLCGAFYTGPDIPGFTGNPPDDLAIRFFQLGAFLPLFRGHSIYFAKDKEPYAFNEHIKTILRTTIQLRYSLLREWYTGFERAITENKNPHAPVFTQNGKLVTDQFLLFDKFLIAPILERDQVKRMVYLPKGQWYVLGDTKNTLQGDSWITVDVTLETLPVFVKAGSIVVRNTVGENTKQTVANEETYEVYLDKKSQAFGYWFNDDGITKSKKGEKYLLKWENGEVRKESI